MLSQRSIGAAGTELVLPSDDEFNRVSSLLHFEGTNNGTNNVYDDSSSSNHTITANGNVTQGSFGPFARPDGEWGVSFPRPNSDNQSIYAAYNSADTAFGTGDFTVELFAFFSVAPGSGDYANVFDFRTAGNTNHIDLYFSSPKRLIYFAGGSSVFTSSTDLPIGEWVHLALVRSSGTTTLYQNGVSVGSASDSNNFSAGIFTFGSRYTSNFGMTGSISNARVVKGDAVYTSAFTPTTSPLTAITNTVFLSAQSSRFVDNSTSAHTVSGVNSPSVSAFGPFLTSKVYSAGVNGASAYFDGTGDYLSAPDSDDFNVGSGLFTAETWIFPTASPNQPIIIGQWSGSYSWVMLLSNDGNRYPRFLIYDGSFWDNVSSTSVPLNAWSHLALVRESGNVFKIYLNGVQVYSVTLNKTANNSSDPLTVGADNSGASPFQGYLADTRFTKGTAVYTSAFTPPTAPLTAVTNTKLLLNMADGQAIDSAAQNDLTLVGTAKTSTAQSAFGTASLLLDGNSDLAKIPSASGDLGSGDWTIEFSFRLSADVGGTAQTCISKWESSGDQRGWAARLVSSSGNKMQFRVTPNGTSGSIVSTTFSTAFSHSTWYNVALVNSSGTVTLYVDGTADSTTYTLASGEPRPNVGIDVAIGAAVPSSPNTFFNGYIDEVRISQVARYTSSYTPAAFADKGQQT
jgi:hypothetical protein